MCHVNKHFLFLGAAILSVHSMLHVNFDPLIVRLLREVKYFLLLGLRVPESALEVFGRGEVRERNPSDYYCFITRKTIMSQLVPFVSALCREARRVGVLNPRQSTGRVKTL